MKRTGIRGSIVYDRIEESTLRSNNTFMSMGYAEKDEVGKSHQLAPSTIRRLNIDMINGFNLDYIHMTFFGIVRRKLFILKDILKVCLMVDCHSQVSMKSRLVCFHLKESYQVNFQGSPGL